MWTHFTENRAKHVPPCFKNIRKETSIYKCQFKSNNYINKNNKNYEAGTSWTAKNSDFAQQLIIDLGSVRNITQIAIQGRPHSVEYVTEFTISYGYNGLDFADFKEPGGNIKVTKASVLTEEEISHIHISSLIQLIQIILIL